MTSEVDVKLCMICMINDSYYQLNEMPLQEFSEEVLAESPFNFDLDFSFRSPTPPFKAILWYDQNRLKRPVIRCFR